MDKIKREVKKQLSKIKKDLDKIDEFLKTAPDGYLNYKIVDDRTYYYHQNVVNNISNSRKKSRNLRKKKVNSKSKKKIPVIEEKQKVNSLNNESENKNSVLNDDCEKNISSLINADNQNQINDSSKEYIKQNNSRWKQTYIRKSEIKLAMDLAQKSYYQAAKPLLEKEKQQLENFLKNYNHEETELLFYNLNNVRKKLVKPIEMCKADIIQQWNNEDYEENDYYGENKIFETEQGDKVRSKSEVIIANMLYEYRKDILYKYERPIFIDKEGVVGKMFPDFTILNIYTGTITYYEHFGCLDDPVYAEACVKKINNYIRNGIMPGKNLVMTYESREHPLDIIVVRKTIEGLL